MNKLKIHVFLDMDGVIADLNEGMRRFTGKKELTEDIFWAELPSFTMQTGFQTLPKMEMADKLVKFLVDELPTHYYSLSILTSVGDFYKPKAEVAVQKKRWLDKTFPQLSEKPFTVTTSGVGKAVFAHMNAYLIDDHFKNVENFKLAGGNGHIWNGTIEDMTQVKFELHKLKESRNDYKAY